MKPEDDMDLLQVAKPRGAEAVELERQLRATHSRLHNAFSSVVFPKRLTESELNIELRSRYNEVVEKGDALSALEIVNWIRPEELKSAHPGADLPKLVDAYSRLEPTMIPMAVVNSGNIGQTGALYPLFERIFEPTEGNKNAALEIVKLLSEALR